MGIKNLHTFLRKTCPDIYKEVHISSLAYKKVAIDVSIYLCRFKTTLGKQWLDGFLQLITILRENEVHPIFVYDTKFPPEKDAEKKQRLLSRLKTKEKTEKIVADWDAYKQHYFITETQTYPTTIPFEERFISNELIEFFEKTLNEKPKELNVFEIDREMSHLLNTLLVVRTEDFELTRKLLTFLNVPWLNASGEAEATCAILCRKGLVDAVLSEDTDVLNYRAPRFLHKLNIYQGTLQEIYFEELLSALEFTPDQFLDFCIMCGTDYNTNVAKIGPEKSYRFIKKYKNLNELQTNQPTLHIESLMYDRVREIFKDDQSLTKEHFEKIKFCGQPDFVQLTEFCFHQNCRFDIHRLKKAFGENMHLCFEEEEKKILV